MFSRPSGPGLFPGCGRPFFGVTDRDRRIAMLAIWAAIAAGTFAAAELAYVVLRWIAHH